MDQIPIFYHNKYNEKGKVSKQFNWNSEVSLSVHSAYMTTHFSFIYFGKIKFTQLFQTSSKVLLGQWLELLMCSLRTGLPSHVDCATKSALSQQRVSPVERDDVKLLTHLGGKLWQQSRWQWLLNATISLRSLSAGNSRVCDIQKELTA